jgi:tetratricopeptide (TPR) repeat protein
MKYITIICLFICFSIPTLSQDIATDTQLADQYYRNKEYDKAEVLYEKLYTETNAKYYFNIYINCLVEQSKYDEAEKTIKKQIRKNRDDLSFYVDLGYIYKQQQQIEKAEEQYNEAITRVSPEQSETYNLANAFITRAEFDKAIEVYKKSRNVAGFSYYREVAAIYSYQRKYPEMIEQYIELLSENTTNLEEVSSRLMYFVTHDVNNEFSNLLKPALIKQIQKEPNKSVFSELLIQLYIQKNDFRSAFIQARSLDKRYNESGKRVLDIAETALSNKQYDLAAEAYKYVETKGSAFPFYYKAKFGYLNVLYTKVTNREITTKEQIQELEEEYQKTIIEIGQGNYSIQTIIDLAHLQAFYLGKTKEALENIDQALNSFGLSNQAAGECLIEKGDIMLLSGDIWGATLVYAKAEKENKDNPTGDKALLQKSKLAFYAHDFLWAKAQLDVLKASTSKMVANDAMELSVLIQHATSEDSITRPLEMYASTQLALFQGKDHEALSCLDSILNLFPNHVLVDDALLKKGEIYENDNNYTEALDCYKKIIDNFSYELLIDDALMRTAKIYEEQLQNKDIAGDFYRKILTAYPNSIYSAEARKRYREIRDGINEDQQDQGNERPVN